MLEHSVTELKAIKVPLAVTIMSSFIAGLGFVLQAFAASPIMSTDNNPDNRHNLINRMEVHANTSVLADGGQAGVTATCPTGWVVTGGGLADSSTAGMFVTVSQPTEIPPNGWFVGVKNTSPDNQIVHAVAMCAHSHRTVTQSIGPMGFH